VTPDTQSVTRADQPVSSGALNEPLEPSAEADLVGLFGQLRAAVMEYVRQLRSAGLQLDDVLPAVQRLVRQAEGDEPSPDELGLLMSQVVRWSLEAYHGEPESHTPPRVS